MGVPLYADHIRALSASFDSKLAYVGNPQYGRAAGVSRPVDAIACDGQVD